MKRLWFIAAIVVLYGALFGQYIYANNVRAFGPHFAVTGNCADRSTRCLLHSCPNLTASTYTGPVITEDENGASVKPVKTRGFPYVTHWTDYGWCPGLNVVRTSAIAEQRNRAYLVIVTVLFAGIALAVSLWPTRRRG